MANELSKNRGPFLTAKRWFGSFVGILDALDVIWLAALLLLFSAAILASPYILARDFLQGALAVPAAIVIATSVGCIAALAIALYAAGNLVTALRELFVATPASDPPAPESAP